MALKKNSLSLDPKLTNKLIFLFDPSSFLLFSLLLFASAFLSPPPLSLSTACTMHTLSTHEHAPQERSPWGWENISWVNHGLSETDGKDTCTLAMITVWQVHVQHHRNTGERCIIGLRVREGRVKFLRIWGGQKGQKTIPSWQNSTDERIYPVPQSDCTFVWLIERKSYAGQ